MFADTVILSKAVFRAVSPMETPRPGGVAVAGKHIVAVGSEAELQPFIGPDTSVYRFGEDSLLLPGFCDSHMHLEMTVAAETGPALRLVKSEQECVSITQKWLKQHPDNPWVVGQGWHQANWPGRNIPDKKLLSEAIPDVPVCLLDVDCHAAWLNKKALNVFGITAATPDSEGGMIYRDENGEPTGYIEESPCLDVFQAGCEANNSDCDRLQANLLVTMQAFNRRGVTSVMDAMDTPENFLAALDRFAATDTLPLRLALTVLFTYNNEYQTAGEKLAARYNERDALIHFWGYKGLVDGVGGIHTAWMTDGYDDKPDVRGYPLLDPQIMKERVLWIEKNGWGVHLHACGTRAVEYGLDMIEQAVQEGFMVGQRNTITHCDTVNDKDFPRFRELGVVASLQPDMLAPTYSYADNFYPQRFGERLMRNAWANRRIFDSADVVSFSSDSPITPAHPMYDIYRATQRIHDDGTPAGGIRPEQKAALSECLWAYTYGGAYQLGREDLLGTLEVGKIADITVLDRNIFAADPENYRKTLACLTMVEGKIVYQS